MDERALPHYMAAVRLLLLLSALLTALSGVASPRAVAQPVQASAAASVAAATGAVVTTAAARFVVPAYASLPPRRLAAAERVVAVIAQPLYAERRRE